ncbi:serine hydrolase domain-containing protein [Acanthopleuribacter pedis]|uniref:Serine hydrolase n=1 Tax=Acanthopleuribacter pedis TaxID=442870 RepID=A0A8J7U2K9_9BACT|nr:serine hydrolase [Acanthopleuribacter pedis]MBO1319428.1 serine hydrolase [Acanthopleuribacter pedis]
MWNTQITQRFMTFTLFVSLTCFVAAGTPHAKNHAPEATAAEAELSFWDVPQLEKGFIDTAPPARKDGLPVGRLGVDGGDKHKINALAEEISAGKRGKFDSLLIAHEGKLLFESYYLRGRINLPHPQASTAKAYTSLVLGRAIQLGHLTMADLDKPLVSILKDLDPSKFVAGAQNITLHKALTMRGGIKITEEQRKAFKDIPDQIKGQGMVQTLLEQSKPIAAADQHFDYGNYNPNLIMQVVDAVVPGSAEDFIKTELLDKLGITNYQWHRAPSGLPESGWRVSKTTRDMVKWGTLVMNDGQWQGEQLISKAYIQRVVKPVIPLTHEQAGNFFDITEQVTNPGYGYFWWHADLKVGNKTYTTVSAQGGGCQFIILVKELDLMVVLTAHDNSIGPLQVTAERIIPAFTQQKIN